MSMNYYHHGWFFSSANKLLHRERTKKLKNVSWKHAQSWNHQKVLLAAAWILQTMQTIIQQICVSEGLSEAPAPSTAPGSPEPWPVVCLARKKALKPPTLQSQWRQLSNCDSIFLVQYGATWLHFGLSSEVAEGCSHFPFYALASTEIVSMPSVCRVLPAHF